MNLLKCAFDATFGKVLGFIVKHCGIEVDQSNIKAIQNMPKPRNLHKLKSLQGLLGFIRRFISNLTGRCQPFSRLIKNDASFIWDNAYRNAFESIKRYLASPHVLGAPMLGKPLLLYIATQEGFIEALLAQENEDQKERALYYLSRALIGAELNYLPIEKMCLALAFAVQKLRHYMQAYNIHLVSKADPIIYIPTKATNGQALVNFLADHPIPTDWKISDNLPDEEVFYIDIFPT
ncbi:hypothetical protein ACFX1S_019302 [Malus domestica]